MTSNPCAAWRTGLWAALAVGLVAGAGCQRPGAALRVQPVDPPLLVPYELELSECVFQRTAHGDLNIVGYGRSVSRATGGREVYLHAHVFWRPHPGVSFADPSGTNALLRYVVVHDDLVVAYEGSGFVYVPRQKRPRPGQAVAARVERALLRRVTTPAAPPDPEGWEYPTLLELTATLPAGDDGPRALRLRREIDLHVATVTGVP